MGVGRSGRGLRVVLDAERGQVECDESLAHVVVEVDVADLDLAVRSGAVAVLGRALTERRRVDREPVIVARDLDDSFATAEHRLVDPAVAERELVGAGAHRPAEQLRSQADAEHGHLTEQRGGRRDGGPDGRRIARTVGDEQTVGLEGAHRVGARVRRQQVHLGPEAHEAGDHGPLHPEVERGDAQPDVTVGTHDARFTDADLADELAARHRRALTHQREQRVRVEDLAGQPGTHRPVLADAARQAPGVDVLDGDDASVAQRIGQRALRAP